MSTDQNIQERAEKHAGQQAPFKNKREREMFVDGYIDGATKERELMSSHKEAAEATILRLYDAIPDNKEELVMLFNLSAEYGRDMSNQWVSVETPPEHGTRVLLRHDYGNGIEYSTDLWCDEVIKFLSLNFITHYQVIHPLLPVIKKG